MFWDTQEMKLLRATNLGRKVTMYLDNQLQSYMRLFVGELTSMVCVGAGTEED